MQAFFVHNQEQLSDLFVTPEKDQMVSADKNKMFQFISAQPDFSQWQGEPLNSSPPDALGVVVASRQDDGDVCIIDEALWQERMTFLLGSP